MKTIVMNPRTAMLLHELSKVPQSKLAFRHEGDGGRLCTACMTLAWVHVQNIIRESHEVDDVILDKLIKTIKFMQSPEWQGEREMSSAEFVLVVPFADEVLGAAALDMAEILKDLNMKLGEYEKKWNDKLEARAKIIMMRMRPGVENV